MGLIKDYAFGWLSILQLLKKKMGNVYEKLDKRFNKWH